MGLRIVKLEDYERWAVIDSVYETMLKQTFCDKVHALLFVAYVDRWALKHKENDKEQIFSALLKWLNEVAPRYRSAPRLSCGVWIPGPERDRILPDAWAHALVDTSHYDEEALARPREFSEVELIEYLESPRAKDTENYLLEQFGTWSENHPTK